MSIQRKTANKEELLLHARQQQLSNPAVGSLRSHGKLWGMDVFSWYKPSLGELESTLTSFPGPICWYANAEEIHAVATANADALKNVHMICSYDRAGFSLSDELLDQLNIVVGAAEIEDALELMKSFKNQHKILLFTSSSACWKEEHQQIEHFLNNNQ